MASGPGQLAWRATAVLVIVSVIVLPLLGALVSAAYLVWAPSSWHTLWAAPEWPGALRATVLSAGLSTALALVLSLSVAASWVERGAGLGVGQAALAPLLAVPHAAFAIGLLALLAPAGWVARIVAPMLGWTEAPDAGWLQDPRALGLILVLALKETPFLLWSLAALLQRPDLAASIQAQRLQAASLGVGPLARWTLVLGPQLVPRLLWPIAAVLAYGLTVVDVAMVIGPSAPPTLAVWSYQALLDADVHQQGVGAAAAWFIAALLPALALLAALLGLLVSRGLRLLVRGGRGVPRPGPRPRLRRAGAWVVARLPTAMALVYLAVLLALAIGSVAGPWSFPDLLPSEWQCGAWEQVASARGTVSLTLTLGLVVATLAVLLAVGWLALTPASWDRASAAFLMLPLLLPPLLLAAGLYPLTLHARLDAHPVGLVWAHLLMSLPYALFVLVGPWRGLDPRLPLMARLLGHGAWTRLWRVQLPLLRAPLAAAWAVAFAVAVAQFVPTQFIGAGRLPTLATEAVTMAASGQRAPSAAWALLQATLPLVGFAAAAWVGQTRRRRSP